MSRYSLITVVINTMPLMNSKWKLEKTGIQRDKGDRTVQMDKT